MTSSNNEPVTRAELEIHRLTQVVDQLTKDLETANQHRPLSDTLAHLSGCPNCQGEMTSYKESIIKAAFDNVDPKVFTQIGISRGILPEKMTVQVP